MRNFVTVLFAGATLATAAFAQGNWANDLNRSKLGRDLPVVEQQPPNATKDGCAMSCCRKMDQKARVSDRTETATPAATTGCHKS